MSEKKLFHFRVLRYIHDSFTGEFLNIGLALYSQPANYFKVRLLQKYARITCAFPNADGEHYRKYIASLQAMFDKYTTENPNEYIQENYLPFEVSDDLIAKILPPDDSAIQFGPIQGGMASDLDIVFDDLYFRFVETYVKPEDRSRRDDQEIWSLLSKQLRPYSVMHLLHSATIECGNDEIELEHAWKNSHWKAMQPISFDLQHPGSIKNKSHQWYGTTAILNKSPILEKLYYLLGKPQNDDKSLFLAYQKAKDLLGKGDFSGKVNIIEEDEVEDFAKDISKQIHFDSEHIK